METDEVLEEKKVEEKFSTTLFGFAKKYKKLLISLSVVLFLCLGVIVVISIIQAGEAQQMNATQIGKCYKETYSGSSGSTTEIHYFTEDGVAHLYVSYYPNKEVCFATGSLKEIEHNYTFKISLGGTLYLDYTSPATPVKLNERNEIVEYCHKWELISLEEALAFEEESYKLYARKDCEHEYEDIEVTKEATCTSMGESKKTCKKCGYVQVSATLMRAHEYINGICFICGEEKQPEKSNIEANTWYTYQDVLHFQNIKIRNAFSVSQGKGMSVSYNFVCQHCHVVDETGRTNVPEFNYAINKIFTCKECGGLTTVKIELG